MGEARAAATRAAEPFETENRPPVTVRGGLDRSCLLSCREEEEFVLHVGLDLGRKRVEVCLISDQGELVDRFTAIPDRDGLHGLARRVSVYGEPVCGVVESMNGARFVHDELGAHGWEGLGA